MTVRRLPIERIDGVSYYRDDRLKEWREVDNPHVRIRFEDVCPDCGRPGAIEGHQDCQYPGRRYGQ